MNQENKNNITKYTKGSEWRKWDLHIHTPFSDGAYGDHEDNTIWENFIKELEESGLNVIGINDYSILEGYFKVKEYKNKGRLENIDLILPVIEYRINCFSGDDEKWKKINMHLLLSNELTDDDLKKYALEEINRDCIDDKKYVKHSDFRQKNPSELMLDFNKTIEKIRKCKQIENKYLISLGYNEWNSLSFENNRKTKEKIVNDCHFLFTASDSKTYNKRLCKATNSKVSKIIINASDKHNFKNKDGHCNDFSKFSWIKSDPTFSGLVMAIQEPDRIEVTREMLSPKAIADKKYIVNEVDLSDERPHFQKREEKLEFNDGLIAIIGNKGSGKSVLGAVIAQAFYEDPEEILNNKYTDMFNKKLPEVATSIEKENIHKSYVKYFTQSYIEKLTSDNDELTALLKNIIEDYNEKPNTQDIDHQKYQNELNDLISYINKNIDIENNINRTTKHITNLTKQKENNISKKTNYTKTVNENVEYKEYSEAVKQISTFNEYITKLTKNRQLLEQINQKVNNFEDIIKNEFINPVEEIIQEIQANDKKLNINEYIVYKKDDFIEQINQKQKCIDDKIDEINSKIKNEEEKKKEKALLLGDIVFTNYLEDLNKEEENIKKELVKYNDEKQKLNKTKENVELKEQECKKLFTDYITQQLKKRKILLDIESNIKESIENICNEHKNIHKELAQELKKINFKVVYDEDLHKNYIANIDSVFDGRKSNFDKNTYCNSLNIIKNKPQNIEKLYIFIKEYCNNKEFKSGFNKDEYFRKAFNLKIEFKHSLQYNGIDFHNLSAGQRGTAILILTLLLDKESKDKVLIIDQPEDNLDNSTVNNVLVPAFKVAKTERQIFLITHNANLVVNSDAEQIVIAKDLRTDGKLNISYESGSLENEGIKDEICNILEGGKEAFRKRGVKMNFIKN